MDKLRSISLVAALSLAGSAYAQTETQTQPGQTDTQPSQQTTTESQPRSGSQDPSAASSPHQRETVGSERTAEAGTRQGEMSELTGVAVENSTGESLGSVVDVVADAAGKPAYVVISTAEKMTAVPYQTAKSMVRNHKIVMDESRLQESPAVAKEQLRARTGGDTWKSEVDQYWSRGPIRSASPEREDPGKRSSEPSQSTSPDDDRG